MSWTAIKVLIHRIIRSDKFEEIFNLYHYFVLTSMNCSHSIFKYLILLFDLIFELLSDSELLISWKEKIYPDPAEFSDSCLQISFDRGITLRHKYISREQTGTLTMEYLEQ